jgi:2-dehydropantoate 2-reductase
VRFAIIGVGGVGGYFGARLSEAGHDITFIARGAHLAAIAQAGLHVHSLKGDVVVNPAVATDDPARVGVVDCMILGVKAWQVVDAARSAAALVGPNTSVLPLQNGVEAPEQVASVLGREHALGGVAKIISYVGAPGHIHHTGAEPSVVIGELDGRSTERIEALRRAFAAGKGVGVSVSTDIQLSLWEKFLFITAWAGVGAVTRAPMGVVRSVPESRRLIVGALEEIERLARARGIGLAPDALATILAIIDSVVPADGTASLQRDIAAGRPSELDNLTGAVVRLGAELGVATPVNSFLYAALVPLERRARGTLAF